MYNFLVLATSAEKTRNLKWVQGGKKAKPQEAPLTLPSQCLAIVLSPPEREEHFSSELSLCPTLVSLFWIGSPKLMEVNPSN